MKGGVKALFFVLFKESAQRILQLVNVWSF